MNNYPDLTQNQLDAIAMVMDDGIREHVHTSIPWCEPGEFLTAYLELDADFPIHQFNTDGIEVTL